MASGDDVIFGMSWRSAKAAQIVPGRSGSKASSYVVLRNGRPVCQYQDLPASVDRA